MRTRDPHLGNTRAMAGPDFPTCALKIDAAWPAFSVDRNRPLSILVAHVACAFCAAAKHELLHHVHHETAIEPSSDVLDLIDEIVLPGTTINVADNLWNIGTTPLGAAFRRR